MVQTALVSASQYQSGFQWSLGTLPMEVSAVPRRNKPRGGEVGGGTVTALIYTRVSTEDQQREGVSLADQLAACRRYCAERGWAMGAEFQDVLSGKREDRPQYQALLMEAER